MSDKPEAMQEFVGPGFYPFPYPYYYPYPFLFRIPPVGFFIGFMPRPRYYPAGSGDYGMCIRHISEAEFGSMRRLGFMEIEVMMEG